MSQLPGPVVLFGSGETSPSGRKVYEWLFSRFPSPVSVAILETPAGFQPNSSIVAGKIGEFLRTRLQNHRPEVSVLPARARGTEFSPEDPSILDPIFRSDVLFAGPGSPTYAVRQLEGSLAFHYLAARHRLGGAVVLASAAVIASGAECLPVYEIYKSGEDLHWRQGLDLFRPFGLSLTFIPHWNNSEGGAELDTSRCFMGIERFTRLVQMLPPDRVIVGIDEQSALVFDPAEACCRVMGKGGVTIRRGNLEARYEPGSHFPVDVLGAFRQPRGEDIPAVVWERALAAQNSKHRESGPPERVLALIRERERARAERNWAESDRLRDQILAMGWRVSDTLDGPVAEPA